MRGLTLGDRHDIVIPSVPAAYRQDPDLEPHPLIMTAAELRRLRESLGLTVRDLAKVTGRNERNVHRWERGEAAIGRETAEALVELVQRTDEAVAGIVAAHTAGEPVLTYATDEDYRDAEPDASVARTLADGERVYWPASWHRSVADRAAQQLLGARIAYRK